MKRQSQVSSQVFLPCWLRHAPCLIAAASGTDHASQTLSSSSPPEQTCQNTSFEDHRTFQPPLYTPRSFPTKSECRSSGGILNGQTTSCSTSAGITYSTCLRCSLNLALQALGAKVTSRASKTKHSPGLVTTPVLSSAQTHTAHAEVQRRPPPRGARHSRQRTNSTAPRS